LIIIDKLLWSLDYANEVSGMAKIYTTFWWLAKFLLLTSLTFVSPTWALSDNPCRKAVVVYLDVSGSMYERRHMTELPEKPGKKVTLMEATVKFLENLFTNETGGVIEKGDYLAIRQFYSKVAPLVGPFDRFDFSRHSRIIRQIGARLDHNKNGRFDLHDSQVIAKNPALDLQGAVFKTNFENLVLDMLRVRKEIRLKGPDSFHQLLFVILTDGGHDASSADKFEEAIDPVGRFIKKELESDRVRVLLFSLGHLDTEGGEYDIRADFEKHLKATFRSLTPGAVDFDAIRQIIIERLADKYIEIKEIGNPVWKGRGEGVDLPILVVNHSCRSESLQKIVCRATPLPTDIYKKRGRSDNEGERKETIAFYRQVIPFQGHLAPARQEGHFADALIHLNMMRPKPGRYRLTMIPYTMDRGPGEKMSKTLVIEPSKLKPGFWVALGGLGLLIVVAAVLIVAVMSRRR